MDEYATASFHSTETGMVDFVCDDDTCVMGCIRELLEMLPSNNSEEAPFVVVTDDLNRISEELGTAVANGTNALKIIMQLPTTMPSKSFEKDMVRKSLPPGKHEWYDSRLHR